MYKFLMKYLNFKIEVATDMIKAKVLKKSMNRLDEDTVYYSDSFDESKSIKYNLYVFKCGKGSELVALGISRLNLSN